MTSSLAPRKLTIAADIDDLDKDLHGKVGPERHIKLVGPDIVRSGV